MKKKITNKIFFLLAFTNIGIHSLYAQVDASKFVGAINDATGTFTSVFDAAVKLVYGIGACVGLIGAAKVYSKYTSGDNDATKTAASWGGGCVALLICATLLKTVFID
jgi:hypothetical protein